MINLIRNNKTFRLFFFADVVSGFGVGMGTVGGNWYMLEQTQSAQFVGFLLTVNVLAGFMISPFAGFLIDKLNRKTIILLTYVFRAALLCLILGIFYFAGFNLYIMYLYAVVNGIGWTVYLSASRSFIQEILSHDNYTQGNSLVEISLQVGMFTAGAASGIIYQAAGFDLILLINILTFVVSSGLVLLTSYSPNKGLTHENREGLFLSFRHGFDYLRKRQSVLFLGVISIIPLAVTMLYNVVLPPYVADVVKGNSVVFGASDMSYGIGGLLSGLLVPMVSKRLRSKRTILCLYALSVVTLLFLGLNKISLILFSGSLLLGLTNSGLRITINSELMQKVDSRFMGRSMAFWNGLSLFIQIIGSSGIGIMINHIGAPFGFVIMCGLMSIGLIGYVIISRTPTPLVTEVPTTMQNIENGGENETDTNGGT